MYMNSKGDNDVRAARPRGGESCRSQVPAPHDAAAGPDAAGQQPGPHQCGLHPGGPPGGRRGERDGVRLRGGALLHRVRPVRGAQQHAAGTIRRPGLADPHHDHLGSGDRGHVLHPQRHDVLRPALPARCRGGRLLPRRDALHHPVAARRQPRPGHRDLPGWFGRRRHRDRPDHRRPAGTARGGRDRRMALDVRPGRHLLGARRYRRRFLPGLPDRGRALARRR